MERYFDFLAKVDEQRARLEQLRRGKEKMKEKKFTKGALYRLAHPTEWVCPTKYEVNGGKIGGSKRDFPFVWREDSVSLVKSIKTVYLKKGLIYSDVIIETWEGEEFYLAGLNNKQAKTVKRNLEAALEKSKGVTLRED